VRIVGGRHRGRNLAAPAGQDVRPTADRVRQAVFNILEHGLDGAGSGFENAVVLDVFAGTGALGLEALSRGAAKAVFIDRNEGALLAARRNAASLGEQSKIVTLRLDAAALPPPPRLAETPAAYAFVDAPYGAGLTAPALAGLRARAWVAPGSVVVAEIGAKEPLPPLPGYALLDERGYGAARVVFLDVKAD
jgi:16S rRNA (guanine966-N2)-methyltransferase